MSDLLDLLLKGEKPPVRHIDSYFRSDGTRVADHFRTDPNDTSLDNLNSDYDGDGIPGTFDADVDGDGIAEACDIDGDGFVDFLSQFF